MARRQRAVVAMATLITLASAHGAQAHHSAIDRSKLRDTLDLRDAVRVETPANRKVARVIGKRPLQLPNGLYVAEVRGTTYMTHGPDPVPTSAQGVAAPSDPQRNPVCQNTGKAVHLLYGYTPGTSLGNFSTTIAPHIRQIMRQNNYVLNKEAQVSSGGTVGADFKVRCEGSGEIKVDAFEIVKLSDNPQTSENESTWNVSDWRRIMAAGEKAGFNDPKVDYEVFTNAAGPSGIATWRPDTRLSGQNENNNPGYPFGSGWAIVHGSSWDRREVSMHELAHAMGAVQNNSPHASGRAHCWDEQDVMCYNDGGSLIPGGLKYNCSAETFDCGYDDYFDAKPATGSYLAKNWNLGSPLNSMIAFSGVAAPAGPIPDFSYSCKLDWDPYFECGFKNTSKAGDAPLASYKWDFGDGYYDTGASPSHLFTSLLNKITISSYKVTMTAVDANGLEASVTKTVLLPLGGGGGGGSNGGDNDGSSSGATKPSSVSIVRIRASRGRKVKVVVGTPKGAQGRIRVTSRQRDKTSTRGARPGGRTRSAVRIGIPNGKSKLIVRFAGSKGWKSSRERYRVKRSGRALKLHKL